MNGAQEPATGVHGTGELERLGASHLADDDPVRAHRKDELDEVAQRDLAGAVQAGRPHLVIAAVQQGNRQLPDLLAAPHTVRGRHRRQERGAEGCLARTGLTRDRDPAALLHDRPQERGCLVAERFPRDECLERDVADRVPTHGCRQPVGDRCDRRGEPSRSVQHPSLHHRMLRVQLPLGRSEQPLEDLTVLVLGGGLRQSAQAPVRVEIRHARTLDEHLLDIASGEQLAERPELGDRPQHPVHHRVGITERDLVTHTRAPLILLDRALDLRTHLPQLKLRREAPAFDA